MSTEHQQYSTENQLDSIRLYASSHNIEIVKIYTDAGKSGLNLEGRKALQQLFRDVESKQNEFEIILVYDVSRWGRFQDPDVSASYEVKCRQSGVAVEYCAEQFVNDGSPISSIIKSIKRMMAGEYSRELSVKVFNGQARIASLGFKVGGQAGYGLRRQLVDRYGRPKGVLEAGELKSIHTDRVVLIPGPESEQNIVREIFRSFIEDGLNPRKIAAHLNNTGLFRSDNSPWISTAVNAILTNEKYAGHNVWNRQSFKLKKEVMYNPEEEWIRVVGAFAPIIDEQTFQTAQLLIKARPRRLTDAQMLDNLRGLLRQCGTLSSQLIDEDRFCPSSASYWKRFGGVLRCYELIGFKPLHDYSYIKADKKLRVAHPKLIASTLELIRSIGATATIDPTTKHVIVNNELKVSIVLSRPKVSSYIQNKWIFKIDSDDAVDLIVIARILPKGDCIKDYFILPPSDFMGADLTIEDDALRELEKYRFDSLEALVSLSRRTKIKRIDDE